MLHPVLLHLQLWGGRLEKSRKGNSHHTFQNRIGTSTPPRKDVSCAIPVFQQLLLWADTIGGKSPLVRLFAGFIFAAHPCRNSECWKYRELEKVCHSGKTWRGWEAAEAKKQHCLAWTSFIWWARLRAGVGLEPSGNVMIYSLSASADRQEANGLYVRACFSVGWLFIRQTAPGRSQYKHSFCSCFSLC